MARGGTVAALVALAATASGRTVALALGVPPPPGAVSTAAAPAPTSPPARAAAQQRPALDLTVTVDIARRHLAGTARWLLPNNSRVPVQEVLLWLYPNRLGDRPAALGDVNFHWLYPNGFSPASMQINAARAGSAGLPVAIESSAAGRATVARIRLPVAVPVGGTTTLEVDFTTELPERLGGFGCTTSRCRLMGGFYPFPMHLGSAGYEAAAPPDRIDFKARVVTPPGTAVLLGDAYFAGGGAPTSTTAAASWCEAAAAGADAPYVTLIAGPPLNRDEVTTIAGRRGIFFHAGVRPPSSRSALLPYVREDRVGLVLEAVHTAFTFLGDRGLDRGRAHVAPTPIILMEAPLRHELVQVHGNVVLVSDRLFEIFPLERLRKFHRLELMRAVFAAALDPQLRTTEPDSDVDLSSEVLALYLIEQLTLREFQRVEDARDLLRPLSFIPAVDQLIYAPLVAASSSYFGDPDDRDLIRDDLRRFSHNRGGGRLIHAKLLDLLRPTGMEQVATAVMDRGLPLRQAAAETFGGSLDWFWGQWLSPTPPRLNYRLAEVHTTPLTTRTGVHVSIEVRREGAQVIEPVEVRVVDRAQVAHELVWVTPGASHRFELELPAGLGAVEVDPRHRLVESAVGSLDAADDPLTDNRTPKAWRFIYSGAAALVDVTALSLSFAAAVRVKPRHDLRNSILLLAHHAPSTEIGVESAYTRLFGHQADPNRLTSAAGLSLSAALLDRDFGVAAGETLRPRWRLTGSLFTEHDDRDYFIDPWRAVGMAADVTYSLTGLDSGERLSQIGTGIELLRLFELFPGHVLALDAQAGATFGDIRVRSQLAEIGGATGLRGYAPGELFGRGRAVGRIELRNRYLSDLDWNLAHFTAVRGLAGNLFFEAGLVTSCDDLTVNRSGLFYDVGYSLRVLHDAFGVYQQLLSVDLAIPLNRHDHVCMGQHSSGFMAGDPPLPIRRPPFVVLLSFLPSF